MIFEQCEYSKIDMVSMGTNEIVQWGDGKYYMRWKPGTELKLERDNQELEDNLELAKRKVCEVILTHIKSLKGNFSEYIENASDHFIGQIQNCCSNFMAGHCQCKGRGSEILALWMVNITVRSCILRSQMS